ncbi:MAG: hypothetical protein QXD23_02500 [Candidatus Micrarchaeaceae archaeon]
MKCSYCQKEIEQGTGFAFIRKSGVARYFCSRRCYKFDIVFKRKIRPKEQYI